MNCCSSIARSTGNMFSWAAPWYALRYRALGLDGHQRAMLGALRDLGVEGSTVLDIGCGVGALHRWLLRHGAARAVGIDLSQGMLEQAAKLSKQAGLSERVSYVQGDFVACAAGLACADVTVLDRVVCCYPNAEALVNTSLDKTRRLYALIYPRDRLLNRWGVGLLGRSLGLLGVEYRAFVHDPERIRGWITARGFRKSGERLSPLWMMQVYSR
jgi:SAM-dependent methyltransferase